MGIIPLTSILSHKGRGGNFHLSVPLRRSMITRNDPGKSRKTRGMGPVSVWPLFPKDILGIFRPRPHLILDGSLKHLRSKSLSVPPLKRVIKGDLPKRRRPRLFQLLIQDSVASRLASGAKNRRCRSGSGVGLVNIGVRVEGVPAEPVGGVAGQPGQPLAGVLHHDQGLLLDPPGSALLVQQH